MQMEDNMLSCAKIEICLGCGNLNGGIIKIKIKNKKTTKHKVLL